MLCFDGVQRMSCLRGVNLCIVFQATAQRNIGINSIFYMRGVKTGCQINKHIPFVLWFETHSVNSMHL